MTGLVITWILIEYVGLDSVVLLVLCSGFEAATVGGLADWFAVTALFREVSIPILKRHTNIIVKNREKLTEGVVDLVTTKWLSTEVIQDKISGLSISKNLIQTLQSPEKKVRTIEFRDILTKLTENLDPIISEFLQKTSEFLQKTLQNHINDIDISTPLGKWLIKRIEQGDHYPLWERILTVAQKTINDPDTRHIIYDNIYKIIQNYKKEGFLKKVTIEIAQFFKGIDVELFTEKIINDVDQFIKEATNNPSHPTRVKFDENIRTFAENLASGEEKTKEIIAGFQQKLADNSEIGVIIHNLLISFKSTMQNEINDNDSSFIHLIQQFFDECLREVENNKILQDIIDVSLKEKICELITKYHPEIGNMVRTSLTALNNGELVNQIEEKVGDDLQYIRLNGAIIGGLAGLLITAFKLIIPYFI
jgi:uncharacterized membrane-anchored protein YjiN (DUF445 family)